MSSHGTSSSFSVSFISSRVSLFMTRHVTRRASEQTVHIARRLPLCVMAAATIAAALSALPSSHVRAVVTRSRHSPVDVCVRSSCSAHGGRSVGTSGASSVSAPSRARAAAARRLACRSVAHRPPPRPRRTPRSSERTKAAAPRASGAARAARPPRAQPRLRASQREGGAPRLTVSSGRPPRRRPSSCRSCRRSPTPSGACATPPCRARGTCACPVRA